MNDRFAPIPVGKVAPAPTHIPAPCPSTALLHAAMDDMAAYSQTLPARIRSTDYDALTTQDERRELTIRKAVNSHDVENALEWMFVRGELSEELSDRIDEVAAEFCEKRLNRSEL